MTWAARMLELHPVELGGLAPEAIVACIEECERHSDRHGHRAVRAQACRSCEDACRQLRAHLG